MAASNSASRPVHTWRDPAASFTSCFCYVHNYYSAILHKTSPTPIGPSTALLFSGINGLAVNASKLLSVPEFERFMFVLHKHFTKFAIDVQRPEGLEPN